MVDVEIYASTVIINEIKILVEILVSSAPPTKTQKATRHKQPPQQSERFAPQTFPIGCRSNHYVSMATNYVFCSYIYAGVILPNRSFNLHPKMGQVNMFNKNEIMKFEQHGKKTFCSNRFYHHVFRELNHEKQNNNRCNGAKLYLTIAFHLDLANAKQGEQRSLSAFSNTTNGHQKQITANNS